MNKIMLAFVHPSSFIPLFQAHQDRYDELHEGEAAARRKMNSGPLAPMLSGPIVAAIFGGFCLLLLAISLATGTTVLFPSTKAIRYRESPGVFSAAICFWLFCAVAAGFVLFG